MGVSRVKQRRWQLTGLAMALAAAGVFQSPKVLGQECPPVRLDKEFTSTGDCNTYAGVVLLPDGVLNNEGKITNSALSPGSSVLVFDSTGMPGDLPKIDNRAGASLISDDLGGRGVSVFSEMDAITNSGTITGGAAAIFNTAKPPNYRGSIKSLTNNGALNGGTAGSIDNDGTITTLTNEVDGTINGVVDNKNGGVIGNFTNEGTLNGAEFDEFGLTAIFNTGRIDELTNETTGKIDGKIYFRPSLDSIRLFTNKGEITGFLLVNGVGSQPSLLNQSDASIRTDTVNVSVIEVTNAANTLVSNAGVIASRLVDTHPYATGSYGVTLAGGSDTLNNRVGGIIGGDTAGVQVGNAVGDGSQASITNSGTIEGTSYGVLVRSGSRVNEFTNNADAVISGGNIAIFNMGTITTLTNKVGAEIKDAVIAGDVVTFTNEGLIDGAVELGTADLDIAGDSGRITGAVTGTGTVNVNGSFTTDAGSEPVKEWLKSLPAIERKVIGEDIKTVQLGWPLGMPMVRNLGDSI